MITSETLYLLRTYLHEQYLYNSNKLKDMEADTETCLQYEIEHQRGVTDTYSHLYMDFKNLNDEKLVSMIEEMRS